MQSLLTSLCQQTNLAQYQAWWIIEFVTQKSKAQLLAHKYELSADEQLHIERIITDLVVHHKPLAYILGFVPFLDLHIQVTPPILIPRPETEEWVNNSIAQLQKEGCIPKTILDIGTGSGCIALAFAKAFPHASVIAVDINQEALELAHKNAQHNNISNITFMHSNLFDAISPATKFDLIVSNPPYISREQHSFMDASVTNWEDHGALFAQDEGLALIKKIITNAPHWLLPCKNSYNLILEIAEYHQPALERFLLACNISNYVFTVDHFNNVRNLKITF